MLQAKVTTALVSVFIIHFVRCDDFHQFFHRQDRCSELCVDMDCSGECDFDNDWKSYCQRGCRYFNLLDLHHGLGVKSLNGTKDTCEMTCTEAYAAPHERSGCQIGCEFMAHQRSEDLMSFLSNEDFPNGPLMSLDTPENDVMTDPGLRRELLPGWWDTEGFKLPQTFIQTVPRDADIMGDYGGSSVYFEETRQSTPSKDSDWLQCAARHTGIPRWLLGSAIGVGITAAIWLRFIAEKKAPEDAIMISNGEHPKCKVTIVMPDEVPLHKVPPPKYSEIADVGDSNFSN